MKSKILLSFLVVLLLGFFVTNYSNSEPRNVLLEFCTGTWCGWCPCGHQAAEQILAAYPGTVILAYHGGSNDPFQNFNGNSVRSMLGFQGYPTGIIDRTNHPGNGSSYPWITYSQWMGRVQSRYTSFPNADVGIDIVSISYNQTARLLRVIVNTTAQQNLNGTYMLQYVLTENGLIYSQSSYSQCPPGGPNYVHKDVVRSMVNGPTGESITSGTWNQNVTYTDTLSTILDASWVWNNCVFNVFVYKDIPGQLFLSNVAQAFDTSLSAITSVTNMNMNPEEYQLAQNYPNPFNPNTSIHFSIPKSGKVSFKVYDIRGREVAVYYNGYLEAGKYNVEFDGSELSSGIYLYTLTAGDFVETKKMILTK